jgi:hypothetical protein
MFIKKPIVQLLATAIIGLSATAASATTISGDWTGNWSGSGITATFDMNVGTENGLGGFNGYFDWTCTSGITCSGIENFSGVQLGNGFVFSTTGFSDPINLAASTYWGTIVNGGNTLVGVDQTIGDTWSATRVHAVPEPGTLALMALGLMGIGLTMRRKLPAANHLKTH